MAVANPANKLLEEFSKHIADEKDPCPLIQIAKVCLHISKTVPEKQKKYSQRTIDYLNHAKNLVPLQDRRRIDWFIAGLQYSLGRKRQAITHAEMALGEGDNSFIYEFLSYAHEELGNYGLAAKYGLKSEFKERRDERFPELGTITDKEMHNLDLDDIMKQILGS